MGSTVTEGLVHAKNVYQQTALHVAAQHGKLQWELNCYLSCNVAMNKYTILITKYGYNHYCHHHPITPPPYQLLYHHHHIDAMAGIA